MDILRFEEIQASDVEQVGGKGLSLGLMAQAGLPVPGGFCLSSAVHRRQRGQSMSLSPELAAQVGAAYQAIGGGPVAVRSSATAEDGAAASFAGQQETYLGLNGAEAVCDAIQRCWASLDSERARAYRRQQGMDDTSLAMAVVVQQLVDAEVAGVLFTRNPLDPEGRTMLVEASWGLGESVVSGRVMPDRFQLDHDTGRVVEQQIATKTQMQTGAGLVAVSGERQSQACLDAQQLAALAALGRQVEEFYKGPRDVEWALAGGKFWLLQARPITTADAAEREAVRRSMIAALQARAEPTGTVWSRFNLSEILPDPTPMTWAIVRRFMSGQGGFGLMFRDLGFDPDPALDEEGIFDLVCGRPYCNLSREARLHFCRLPYEHSFAALKANPSKALYPQPIINPSRAGWSFWLLLPLRLPGIIWQLVQAGVKQQRLAQEFPRWFREQIIPAFRAETAAGNRENLADLGPEQLLERLEFWIQRTLIQFARESLKPTALAALAMARLEQKLAQTPLGAERAAEAVRSLVMGVHPDVEADLPRAVREVSQGQFDRAGFLECFGHRGSQEMELARPRWSEDPAAVERLFDHRFGATNSAPADPNQTWDRVMRSARLPPAQHPALKADLDLLHTLLGLRETAKHHLMAGYALIRRLLVELDSRYRLNGGIFYLTPEELPRLVKGEDLTALSAQRRRQRTLALSLEVPAVLFSDDLEAIGRPIPVASTDLVLQGTALSAGSAEALALVLDTPQTNDLPTEPYILVCPSTDPAWVPLFVQARGLVMETGGVLSHGAIVAREFGLPAVAGLPGITRQLRTGQRLRVDGTHGKVMVVESI
jgi:pyruvate,water dikinase